MIQELYDKMKERLLQVSDPNDVYSYEDFEKEFSNIDYTKSSENPDFFKVKLGFSNKSTNPDPEYATAGSSGFDFRANLTEPMVLKVGKRAMVPTGLFFELPEKMEITIRSRSGLAYKHGVVVLNGIGTIDSDYRGEIGVLLINHGREDFIIQHGDRIAQGIIATVSAKNIINLARVAEISNNTERGTGGFGSTGRN
jgi:dUTP pyrophosphatase